MKLLFIILNFIVMENKTATFGSGCFWCTEAIFELVEGVESVESGYSAGKTENPTYKEVTSGKTNHAEVVNIEYDPSKVSYAELLEIFWRTHDPTTLNRQGADVGTQYRSIILFHDDEQKKLSEETLKKASLQKMNPMSFLNANNSYEFFEKIDDVLHELFQRRKPYKII